jgi:hypothetical protein
MIMIPTLQTTMIRMKKSRFQTKLGEKMRESNRLPFYINDPYPIEPEPETEVTEPFYKGNRTLWQIAFALIGLLLLYLLI